jgi:hypothetical protein
MAKPKLTVAPAGTIRIAYVIVVGITDAGKG